MEPSQIAFNMMDYLFGGDWFGGISGFYTEPLGVVAPSFLVLIVSLAAYIKTQRIEYVAGLWLLIGMFIEVELPGPALLIGRTLMILGLFVLFFNTLFRRVVYG